MGYSQPDLFSHLYRYLYVWPVPLMAPENLCYIYKQPLQIKYCKKIGKAIKKFHKDKNKDWYSKLELT